MAKEKRVKMYNKGTRAWTFKDNGKEVFCEPGKSIELNASQAAKFVKNYPKDFLAGEPVQRTNDSKKLKAEIAKLTEENEALKAQIAEWENASEDTEEPADHPSPAPEGANTQGD